MFVQVISFTLNKWLLVNSPTSPKAEQALTTRPQLLSSHVLPKALQVAHKEQVSYACLPHAPL